MEEAACSLDGGNASPWIANDWSTDGVPKHLRVHGSSMYSLVPAERYRWREGGAPVIESVEKTKAQRQGAELRRGIQLTFRALFSPGSWRLGKQEITGVTVCIRL